MNKGNGLLINDDTTLDKPYAEKMDLVSWHWSGKHKRAVRGINLLTLLWSGIVPGKQVEAHIPCDFRLYCKKETKNEHFRAMLEVAQKRGFNPQYVVFDSWYSSLDNLKKIRSYRWHFFTRLKSNRLVNPDDTYNRRISEVEIPEDGRVVHLKGFGFVKVFRTDDKDDDARYWVTNHVDMSADEREELARQAWGIETYHRQLKQYCGAEHCQHRNARAQHNHLLMSIRAFLRLELNRLRSAVSFFESKLTIIRQAVRDYLANPSYILNPPA